MAAVSLAGWLVSECWKLSDVSCHPEKQLETLVQLGWKHSLPAFGAAHSVLELYYTR